MLWVSCVSRVMMWVCVVVFNLVSGLLISSSIGCEINVVLIVIR